MQKELGEWETTEMAQWSASVDEPLFAMDIAADGRARRAERRCTSAALGTNSLIAKPLKPLPDMARPAGIEPATPAFGGREIRSMTIQEHPEHQHNVLILLDNKYIAV